MSLCKTVSKKPFVVFLLCFELLENTGKQFLVCGAFVLCCPMSTAGAVGLSKY